MEAIRPPQDVRNRLLQFFQSETLIADETATGHRMDLADVRNLVRGCATMASDSASQLPGRPTKLIRREESI